MMPQINLIPARRREARQRRRHVCWVSIGCSAYALAAALSAAVAWACHNGNDAQLHRQLQIVEQEIQLTDATLSTLNRSISADQVILTADRQLANRPDFSALLALLAQKADRRVWLRSLQLNGVPFSGAAPSRFVLVLTGLSGSPTEAQDYVMCLEKSRLFERVVLVDTHREPFAGGVASLFRVECALGPGTTADPPSAATETGR